MVEPLSFYDLNVGTTVALTAAMVRHGVKRMVFSSSAAVYRPSENPLTEASPTGPQNPYGRTKLHSEEILRDACAAHGLSVTALRYFNAAGSDPEGRLGERHHPETHLIPIVLDVALGRRPRLDIFGTDYDTPDGTAVRDYIHVSDLARAHVDAIDHAATEDGFRAFNLGVGRGASVLEVLRAAERVVGRPIPHRFSPRRAGDPPRLVADPALALRRLRWLPAYPELETMIAHCWAFRQNLSVPSECLSV